MSEDQVAPKVNAAELAALHLPQRKDEAVARSIGVETEAAATGDAVVGSSWWGSLWCGAHQRRQRGSED